MKVELVHISGSGRVEPKALETGEYILGREHGCALRVPSGQVSRRHCAFKVSEVGISVEDLGSSNGTWVNARRVEKAHLSAGDLVAVGPLVFVIRIDGTPEEIDASTLYQQGLPGQEDQRVPEQTDLEKADAAAASDSGITQIKPLVSSDDSSIVEFEFDFEDDDDDQPPL